MDRVCPLCNGMMEAHEICDWCGAEMEDQGRMEDYYGPYSPYMDKESFTEDNRALLMGDHHCVHLYQCKVCNRWDHKTVVPMFF